MSCEEQKPENLNEEPSSSTQENQESVNNDTPEIAVEETNVEEKPLNTINALDLAGEANIATEAPSSNQALNVSGTSLNSNEAAASMSYEKELARLRGIIKEKDDQLAQMEKRVSESETAARTHSERLNQQFSAKLEESIRALKESSQRDKNSMVMKYVEGEKKCIELNRHIELLQAKLTDASKERQRMEERIQAIRTETERLNAENDKRLKDMMTQKKELDRLKEQLILSDAREKASQLKLTKELEAHLVTRRQLEAANSEIIQLKNQEPIVTEITEPSENNEIEKSNGEKVESQAENSSNGIKAPNESRGSSPNPESSETSPPKSQQQATNVAKVPSSQTLERNDKAARELAALRSQLKDMFEERTTLRDRLQCMDQERKLQEMNLSKYKETLQSQKQMNKDLLDEILQLRESKETLENIQNEKKQLDARLASLTAELNELQTEMKQSQEKQNELLAFTAKLTEKNTQLQSENTVLKEKLQQIETYFTDSNRTLRESNENLKLEVESLGKTLSEKSENLEKLDKELKESQRANEELKTKLSDERDEVNTLKKKHAANIKDLTKQLQTLQKRAQTQSATAQNTPQSLDQSKTSSSRENSINSLSGVDKELTSWPGDRGDIDEDRFSLESSSNITPGASAAAATASNRYQHEVLCDGVSTSSNLASDDVYVFDIDKQKLIDKIVKLQKKLAKANEKTDFMQDHVNQLTSDLKKKTRIIQAYAIKEDAGAFTSEAQDAIKREMSKKTGIMSTLYNTHKSYVQTANFIKSHESNMTMELCLEINSKLQALLEDILIKNITLKESLETLGTEVARLSKENRQLKLKE